MPLDPHIVSELRSMFLTGATPWRLVRHIATRHEGEPNWPDLVGAYFAEAFSVTTIAMDRCPHPVDIDGPAPSLLDAELLRDMVGRAHLWRTTANAPTETTWCDGLSVSPDDFRMIQQIQPESHPALADSWASFPPRVKSFIRQSMVNAQGYHERTQVLSKLVERLQQQIVESELHREEANA